MSAFADALQDLTSRPNCASWEKFCRGSSGEERPLRLREVADQISPRHHYLAGSTLTAALIRLIMSNAVEEPAYRARR